MKKMQVYTKEKSGYSLSYSSVDKSYIYEHLAQNMVYKKLCHCTYIKRITRKNNYNGTQDITIYMDNKIKIVYTIKA